MLVGTGVAEGLMCLGGETWEDRVTDELGAVSWVEGGAAH